MRTTSKLMDELGAALQFPDCFGENWLALEDCLCDLSECMPFSEIFFIVTNSHQILTDESDAALHVLFPAEHNSQLPHKTIRSFRNNGCKDTFS
ncbi:MAG: barstar family protein [Planctomycetaceae bacterium]|jgi:RNAse (barnase) inhibitor barstar|nr:barstar family protein [Planctomycetaceae bacterium]